MMRVENQGDTALCSADGPDGARSDPETQQADAALKWLLDDEPQLSAEEETQAALDQMRRDRAIHVTTPVLRYLLSLESPVGDADEDSLAGTIAPHLFRCRHCRWRVRQALEMDGASEQNPASVLLNEIEEGVRWQAAAVRGAESAQRALHEAGVGYVYGRDGRVYHRLPDGREELLS